MEEKSEMSRKQLLTILAGLAGATSLAQNGGEGRKIGRLFENDWVQVFRIRKRAHEVTPMHNVTPGILVFLTDSSVRLTHAGGATRVEHYRAGDIKWTPGERVESEILSEYPVEIIMVAPRKRG
jgi:hypothetical protein